METRKRGRPPKNATTQNASDWTTDERLQQLQEWSASGLFNREIAAKIGISISAFYVWLKKEPKLKDAIITGRQQSVDLVENALFQAAINGNTTAMIFFLKNKAPDRYRDRYEKTIHTDAQEIKLNIR